LNRGARVDLAKLLKEVPIRSLRRRLARCVPHLDFMGGDPPRFLFASGRANRCNPKGVRCIYFSEDERTAASEYRQTWRGLIAEHQPKLTFFARAHFRRILDLGNPSMVELFGLFEDDLFGSWRAREAPTRLQELGLAISRQRSISALRYPSAPCHGKQGWNLAIFLDALNRPDRIEILGKSDRPFEVVP
jgi:RES domain-containing protein